MVNVFFFLLQKVFQTRKEMLIKKTVARLPLSAVIPLVEEVRITPSFQLVRKTNWARFLLGGYVTATTKTLFLSQLTKRLQGHPLTQVQDISLPPFPIRYKAKVLLSDMHACLFLPAGHV